MRRFALPGGNRHDVTQADALLTGETPAVLADKGYDSRALRERLEARGCTPFIPPRAGTTCPPDYDEDAYKERNLIERAFAHLKEHLRFATRYDKPARNFEAAIALTAMRRWLMV